MYGLPGMLRLCYIRVFQRERYHQTDQTEETV
jgi:hypothetical protein